MSSQLIKNAKDPEDLDELLDFSNKSYRDCKSKKSGLEINFPLLYGYIRNRVVFFATPCITINAHSLEWADKWWNLWNVRIS